MPELTIPVQWDDRPIIITEAGSENLLFRLLLKKAMYLLIVGTPQQRDDLSGTIANCLDDHTPETCPDCGELYTECPCENCDI